MSEAEKFRDKIARKYAKSPVKNMQAYQETLILTEKVKEIRAIDISGNMIGIAKNKVKEQLVDNVSFRKATLFDARLEPISFDVVMAFNFLHLREDTEGTIRRLRELAKPGGLFISKTVCLKDCHRVMIFLIFVMRKPGLAPCVKPPGFHELEGIFVNTGFHILETGLYPAAPPNRFIVARKV